MQRDGDAGSLAREFGVLHAVLPRMQREGYTDIKRGAIARCSACNRREFSGKWRNCGEMRMLTKKARIAAQADLERLGAIWQKRLRLRDWQINYELVTNPDWHYNGDSKSHVKYKRAHVKVLDPRLVRPRPDWMSNPDVEITLVHELLHCHAGKLNHYGEGTLEERDLECLLEMSATALVEAYRNGRKNA
jgi:hypothetical protein